MSGKGWHKKHIIFFFFLNQQQRRCWIYFVCECGLHCSWNIGRFFFRCFAFHFFHRRSEIGRQTFSSLFIHILLRREKKKEIILHQTFSLCVTLCTQKMLSEFGEDGWGRLSEWMNECFIFLFCHFSLTKQIKITSSKNKNHWHQERERERNEWVQSGCSQSMKMAAWGR